MARVRSIPLGTYPSGVRTFGPFATPLGLEGVDFRIGRCTSADPSIWDDPATIITLDLQFSYDGGVTWTALGANRWSQGGGIIVQRGIESAESVISWRFAPDEPNAAKAQVTVENGPVRTYLDVTVV